MKRVTCTLYSTWCIMIRLVIPILSLLLFIQSLSNDLTELYIYIYHHVCQLKHNMQRTIIVKNVNYSLARLQHHSASTGCHSSNEPLFGLNIDIIYDRDWDIETSTVEIKCDLLSRDATIVLIICIFSPMA